MEREYKDIYNSLKLKGLFSEYLPPCFEVSKDIAGIVPKQDCDVINPYSFTMSRFNSNDSRRTIFIPEICSYLVVNEYMKENQILEEVTSFIDSNSESFSKVIMEDGSISTHEQVYGMEEFKGKKENRQYIDNVVKKIIRAAGAKKVLKLDIANCYSSFYTHYIPAIVMGYEEAEKMYQKAQKQAEDKGEAFLKYKKYSGLDSIIRKQNKNQTNGLLVGPIISRVIMEGLLTRIDIELKAKGLIFSRYVDDYEVCLFENNEEQITQVFLSVLRKYGLTLNFEKTEVINFPYYAIQNFDKIIEVYQGKEVGTTDVIKLFNDFFEIEQSGAKGAVRYLVKTLSSKKIEIENVELLDSYILTIMANDARSLTKACSLLIASNTTNKLKERHVSLLKKMMDANISKGYDLEVIWLLYVLIETNNVDIDDKVVKEILNTDNELAHLMIVRKGLTTHENMRNLNSKSWILNYELYASDVISEEELFDRLILNKNKECYKKIKDKKIHFCYH